MTLRPLNPAGRRLCGGSALTSLNALLTAARRGDHAAVIQAADELLRAYLTGHSSPGSLLAEQEAISEALDTCARLLQFERDPPVAGDRMEPEVRG